MARRGPSPISHGWRQRKARAGSAAGRRDRAAAADAAGGVFSERLLFLEVNIVMPLRLASADDIANAEIGLFYALLVGYHGSPLFYSLLDRYATRKQILILAVALGPPCC